MFALQDFNYALRLLLKRPGFSILTIIVMAVGIGLSLYLFSFLHTMAYKPLPFKDGESLIMIDVARNGMQLNGGAIDLHDFHEIRTNVKGLAEVGLYSESSVNVAGRDGARRLNATYSEPNLFQLTRVKPLLGRSFNQAENQVGADNVAVIGYDFWQNQFAGDPAVLSHSLRINGETTRIIGVMPEGYFFPRNSEIWLPNREDATKINRGKAGNYGGVAHLSEGVTLEDINPQLASIMQRMEKLYPKTNTGISAYATTFPMSTMGNGGGVFLYSMFIVSGLLLLLASINVGNLLLSRSVERGKETAIRVALGAPRIRLIGQMLWESAIICSLGGIIGLLMAAWGLEVTESITATFTDDKPFFWWKFGIDAFTVKLFFALVLVTILLTGVLPAWKNSGADFLSVLRDGTRGALGKKAGRLNRWLVISEVFLSICVLITAAVMVTGTYIAVNADYGADSNEVLTARLRLADDKYGTPEQRAELALGLQSRLEKSVGIGAVSIVSALPGDYTWMPTVAVDGEEYVDESSYPRANYVALTPGSLQALGVSLRSGRYFNSGDNGLDKRTVIVTEGFAKKHFGDEGAIGKRLRIVETDGETPEWLTIVGVVEHVIHGQSFAPTASNAAIFRSVGQAPRFSLTIAMKLEADASIAIRTLRATLESIDTDLPAYLIKTYDEKLARNTAGIGFASKIFALFAFVAVILASSGIYGVMSNTIVQRTQEIGVKRALGAADEMVTREYLLKGLKQLLWGAIPGLLAGGGVGFALAQLMGTKISTLVILALSTFTIIALVVIVATYLPTRRALRVEPSEALRYE